MTLLVIYILSFFFSSRRRHTRCSRDWSSDVCSSDLVAQQVLGQTREQKQEKHRRLVPGAPERAVDLGERVPPDEPLQRGPTHHPGEPEVEGRAERDADGGVEEPSPRPEDVAGGERGDLAGDGGDHDLQKLDGNAPQRAGRAALAQQGDQVVLVRDAMQYARVPQHATPTTSSTIRPTGRSHLRVTITVTKK